MWWVTVKVLVAPVASVRELLSEHEISQILSVFSPWLFGRDSVVGIATRCQLDGPGIEYRGGGRFRAPVQAGPGAHPPSYTMGTGSLSQG